MHGQQLERRQPDVGRLEAHVGAREGIASCDTRLSGATTSPSRHGRCTPGCCCCWRFNALLRFHVTPLPLPLPLPLNGWILPLHLLLPAARYTMAVNDDLLQTLFADGINFRFWDTKDKVSSKARFDRPKGGPGATTPVPEDDLADADMLTATMDATGHHPVLAEPQPEQHDPLQGLSLIVAS